MRGQGRGGEEQQAKGEAGTGEASFRRKGKSGGREVQGAGEVWPPQGEAKGTREAREQQREADGEQRKDGV